MFFHLIESNDVPDGPAAGDELVGDESAVAAPGERFGAHDRRPRLPGKRRELIKGASKRVGLHVIGKGGERGDPPAGVV